MTNGHVNGAGDARTVQVNPQQAAAFALQFLPRCPHTQAEREAYDVAVMFLQAICGGQVVLAPAPQPQVELEPAPAPPAPAPN